MAFVALTIGGISKPFAFFGSYAHDRSYYEPRRNRLFIKREDLLPFSFGGNKAKAGTF